MVSLRCKMIVKEELKKLGLEHIMVNLGMVDIPWDLTQIQNEQLKKTFLDRDWNYWTIKKAS